MDLLTVSRLYHAGGTMVPVWLGALAAALLLAMGLGWKRGTRWRTAALLLQRSFAGVGLAVALWLVVVEVLVFQARCPFCLVAALTLAAAFGVGLAAPTWRAWGAVLVLVAGGLGYLLPFGTVPKIRMIAERAPAVEGASVLRSWGRGPLVMQEFADFQCPACAQMDRTIERFVEESGGQVRLVYRHLPLPSIHRWAEPAARVSECAARQNRFREVKRMLFERQTELGLLLRADASFWNMPDSSGFAVCVNEKQTESDIQADIAEARRLHLRSTPSILIGQTLIVGTVPLSRMSTIVDFARTDRTPPLHPTAEVPTADCGGSLTQGGCGR